MSKSASLCATKAFSAACCLLLLQPLLVMAQKSWTVESIYNTLAIYDASSIDESQLWAWRNSTAFSLAAGLLPGDDTATSWAEYYTKFENYQTTLGWLTSYHANSNSPVCFQPQTATLGEAMAALSSNSLEIKTRDDFAAMLNSLLSSFSEDHDDVAEGPKLSDLLNLWVDQGRSMLSHVTKEQSLAFSLVEPTTDGSVTSTTITVELAAGTIPNGSPADATLSATIPSESFVRSVTVDSRLLSMSVYNYASSLVWEKLQGANPITGPLTKLRGPIDLGWSFKPLPLTAVASSTGCNAVSTSRSRKLLGSQ